MFIIARTYIHIYSWVCCSCCSVSCRIDIHQQLILCTPATVLRKSNCELPRKKIFIFLQYKNIHLLASLLLLSFVRMPRRWTLYCLPLFRRDARLLLLLFLFSSFYLIFAFVPLQQHFCKWQPDFGTVANSVVGVIYHRRHRYRDVSSSGVEIRSTLGH